MTEAEKMERGRIVKAALEKHGTRCISCGKHANVVAMTTVGLLIEEPVPICGKCIPSTWQLSPLHAAWAIGTHDPRARKTPEGEGCADN